MRKITILVTITALLSSISCTKLDETLYSKVSPDQYGKTPAEIQTIVGRAYATLRGYPSADGPHYATEFVWFLSEVSSDEAVIPTRGTDWFDKGVYQQLQSHAWNIDNDIINKTWEYLYSGISAVNGIIYTVSNSQLSDDAKAIAKAELRGVRAFYYYQLCDLYGNVPIETTFGDVEPKTNSPRSDVYKFIETELLDIVDKLPETGYAKFTKNVCYTLMARLYLNAEIFNGTPEWQKCIDACDKVKGLILEPNYFTNFLKANEVSKENIFTIPFEEGVTTGNYAQCLSLHYKAKKTFGFPTDCVNGICAEPGVYSKYDTLDLRRKCLLQGPQLDLATGQVVKMDDGNALIYTENIGNWKKALQNEGVRFFKYEVTTADKWEHSNDWVLMRYSEVLLMKAEALMRLGQADVARPLIAQVRTRAKLETPAKVDLDFLYNELLYEFMWENHRRTDNIRFGKFGQASWAMDGSDKNHEIFPIPKNAIATNTKLVQNPGY